MVRRRRDQGMSSIAMRLVWMWIDCMYVGEQRIWPVCGGCKEPISLSQAP